MMNSPQPAIAVKNLTYRPALRKQPVLHRLSLSVAAGERVLILGASGSGKSTFMLALAGLLGSDDEGDLSGSVQIHGFDPRQHKGHAGLVMQDPETQVVMHRIFDDMAFGPENLQVDPGEITDRVHRAQDLVGLQLPPNHPTAHLSGGQKQRLALASVLAMQPHVLLLDEPTANLDPDGVEEVVQATRKILDQTQATLVVVEHRVDPWLTLIDRVIVLDQGTVIADDTPEQMFNPKHPQYDRLVEAGVWLPSSNSSSYSSFLSWSEKNKGNRYSQPSASACSCEAEGAHQIIHEVPGCTHHHTTTECTAVKHPSGAERTTVKRHIEIPVTTAVNKTCHHRLQKPKVLDDADASTAFASALHTCSVESLPIIATSNVSIGYTPQNLLQTNLTLNVFQGESVCITGRNGSGKTTLALTLAGLLDQVSGEVLFTPTGDDPHGWKSSEYLGRIAFVFQEPEAQFVTQTVEEELLVALKIMGVADAEAQARTAHTLQRLRLSHLAHAHPMTLSGGEKRRLSVATALICAPRLIILDEPTFGQDAQTWIELVGLLQEVKAQGTTVISVTHDRAFIDAFADRVIDLQPAVDSRTASQKLENLDLIKSDARANNIADTYDSGRACGQLDERRCSDQHDANESHTKRLKAESSSICSATQAPSDRVISGSPSYQRHVSSVVADQSASSKPRTHTQDARRPSARVSKINPVAQLVGLLVLTTPLLVSIDLVSAGVALLLELALFLYLQISLASLGKRAIPLLVAAPLVGLSMLLYADPHGAIFATFGPATISSHSCMVAASITVRVFALALPAIALLGRIDPSDMASGLSQLLRLPARPVLASLAGVRLIGLFVENYQTLQQAHRIRGVLSKMALRARLSLIFALLVFALRRSASLSLTMEARGFGFAQTRTWVRRSTLGTHDLIFILFCLVIPLISLGAALYTGTFTPFGYR